MGIQSISYAASVYGTQAPTKHKQRGSQKASIEDLNGDSYNPQQQVKFDKQGYPKPDDDKLTLKPETSLLFGLIKFGAEYTYKASGRETIKNIREKFHLKDGALKRCNSYIVDADWVPQKGTEIYFMKEDIKIK